MEHHDTLAATERGQGFVNFFERRWPVLPVVSDPNVARRTNTDIDLHL
jgi:hypothetical protein